MAPAGVLELLPFWRLAAKYRDVLHRSRKHHYITADLYRWTSSISVQYAQLSVNWGYTCSDLLLNIRIGCARFDFTAWGGGGSSRWISGWAPMHELIQSHSHTNSHALFALSFPFINHSHTDSTTGSLLSVSFYCWWKHIYSMEYFVPRTYSQILRGLNISIWIWTFQSLKIDFVPDRWS